MLIGDRGDLLGDARGDRRLAGGDLALPRLQDVAHERVLDLVGFDARCVRAPRGSRRRRDRPPAGLASAPWNLPIGVRAPATITERRHGERVYDELANAGNGPSGAVRDRLLDDLEDVLAHQLVAVDQRVAQGRVDVAVLGQDRLAPAPSAPRGCPPPAACPRCRRAPCRRGSRRRTARATRRRRRSATRPCRTNPPCSRPASWRARGRAAGPVPDSPMHSSSATSPPSAIAMPASISDLRAREALLLLAVREQSEGAAALDDREHLEAPVLAEQVGDRGVTRLVRRHGLAVGVRVGRGLLQPDLLGELGLHHVLEVHLAAARRGAPPAGPRRTGARSSRACSRRSRARCARAAWGRRAARGASCDRGRSRSARCARPWSAGRSRDGGRSGPGAGAPDPGSRRGSWRRSAGCCCSAACVTRSCRSVGR